MIIGSPKAAAGRGPRPRLGGARAVIRNLTFVGALGLAAVAGMPGSPPAAAKVSGQETGAHVGSACQGCRVDTLPESQITAHTALGADERSCTSCHAGAATASHPVGFVPGRALPDAFPLGDGGAMTCGTCHDLRTGAPGLLRATADGEHMCLSCHETAFFADLPDPVRAFMFSGHLDTRGHSAAGIDAYSLRCMVCHADRGPTSRRTASISNALPYDAGQNNHSIGVDYDEAARTGGYEPITVLPDEVFLPEGRVGCVSCHVPYSRKHGRRPQTRTGLCLSCHAL